ncbi:MAG TPA: hypothetical protein VFM31_09830, partial [Nitrososphaeraceae archaeon]|nr:hypothetical protein [Nitrososphaeraceae archaeon]
MYNLQSKIEETKLLLKQKGNQKKKTTTSSSTSFTKLPIICDVDTLRTLIRKRAKVRVVDVRRIEDYKKGHI